MAVPKSRRTKSSRDRRRSHIFIKPKTLVDCPNCEAKTLPHRACPGCGQYKGRQVVDIKADKKKETESEGFKSPI